MAHTRIVGILVEFWFRNSRKLSGSTIRSNNRSVALSSSFCPLPPLQPKHKIKSFTLYSVPAWTEGHLVQTVEIFWCELADWRFPILFLPKWKKIHFRVQTESVTNSAPTSFFFITISLILFIVVFVFDKLVYQIPGNLSPSIRTEERR